MTFNFNEQDLAKAEEGKVFNNGIAGRVEGVKVTMEKLGKDYQSDSPNAPEYRVVFEDREGRKTNRACFPIESKDYPNQWGKTYEETIKKEWAYLCKIAEHSGGTKPMVFADAADLYDKMYTSGIGTGLLNIFVNYGSKQSPKDRIEIRKWLPAVEPASVTAAESKLVASNIEQLKPIVADATDGEDAVNDLF